MSGDDEEKGKKPEKFCETVCQRYWALRPGSKKIRKGGE